MTVRQLIAFYPDAWNKFCYWMDHGHRDAAFAAWSKEVPAVPAYLLLDFWREHSKG